MTDFFPSKAWHYCPFCGAESFRPGAGDFMQCASCGEKFYINTAAAVAGVIVNPRGEILLVRRKFDPAKGTLDLPGGFVNIDETAEDAVRREIHEELNLHVDAVRYIGDANNHYLFGKTVYFTLDLGFECEISDFSGIVAADDVEEYMFLLPAKLDLQQIGFYSIRKILQIYCQKNT
ncbi:MAG: NUDIX domain-containing protein [Bacteroidales bacterium]|jgi:8-oxo-dGTP pyrophosphatase MutT (NUDIX family)|nr:NUDIX domain-containing protein [Bacteroidales bacterium]